jgi:arylamine N-acetyltransferase
VARHTAEGRITIDNHTFREWRGGEVVAERRIGGQQELLSLLEERFGICLPASVQ